MGKNKRGTDRHNSNPDINLDMNDNNSRKKNSYTASEREALILRIREAMKLKRENEDLKHEISSLNKEISKENREHNMKLQDFSDNKENQKNSEPSIKQSEDFQQVKQIPQKKSMDMDADLKILKNKFLEQDRKISQMNQEKQDAKMFYLGLISKKKKLIDDLSVRIKKEQSVNLELQGKIEELFEEIKKKNAERNSDEKIKILRDNFIEKTHHLRTEYEEKLRNISESYEHKIMDLTQDIKQLKEKTENNKSLYLKIIEQKKEELKQSDLKLKDEIVARKKIQDELEKFMSNDQQKNFENSESDDVKALKRHLLLRSKILKSEAESSLKGKISMISEDYRQKISEFETRVNDISLKLLHEIEKNNVIQKENQELRTELVEAKNQIKMNHEELNQEKTKLEHKEAYIPLMMKITEEESNTRLLNIVKSNVEKEAELQSKIAELKQKLEEQNDIISRMRHSEKEFFLNLNKFGRQIALNSKKSLDIESFSIIDQENSKEYKEIEPIIKTAVDHRDSKDKIKKSLLSSGYNEDMVNSILDKYI